MAEHDEVDIFDAQSVEEGHKKFEQHVMDVDAQKRGALLRRRDAYVRLFGGAPMQGDRDIVMNDLKSFCRGDSTPWDADPRVHALLTGRNEVFRRIVQHTTMPFEELYALLDGGNT